MDKVLEAFRNCITDRKCENRDCPYESRCQITNGKDQYFQIPKQLAFDVDRILGYLLKVDGWNPITEDAEGCLNGWPGDDGQYLMTDGKDIWIDDYSDYVEDGIVLDSGRNPWEIKAWMIMPELPI